MANNCGYEMLAVSKSNESLNRLIRIMNYEDSEYFLYRVFSAEEYERDDEGRSNLFAIKFVGDVAWSAKSWVHDDVNLNIKSESGAHYSNLREICKALDIGVEVFTEEPGCCFQEHYRVNHNGELTWDECADWQQGITDDGDIDESLDEGGVNGYLEWSDYDEIYG